MNHQQPHRPQLQHILDLTLPGIDLLFRDNCYLRTFYWEDEEASDKELICQALRAAQLLSELFISTVWTIEESPVLESVEINRNRQGCFFGLDLKMNFEAVEEMIQHRLSEYRDSSFPWLTCTLQTAKVRASRIALPEGINNWGIWAGVDCDGIKRDCEVDAAPSLYGLPTAWTELRSAIPAEHISITMEMTGEITIHLKLGNAFYEPSRDPRPLDYLIHSRTLREWQQANRKLLEEIFEKMKHWGWREIE